ncbi:MAG TPA: DUF433 domain-containing protein [Anaerolineae bacterium]|nr:DUF433 domain-containing protein [Anaerolineae bacterium]
MSLKELELQLSGLTPVEKAQILERLAQDLGEHWLGVEKTPGVAGGEACIVRTRIPVWALEGYRRLGWSDERILENYPSLRQSDLLNAWAYVQDHSQEIERAIKMNELA